MSSVDHGRKYRSTGKTASCMTEYTLSARNSIRHMTMTGLLEAICPKQSAAEISMQAIRQRMLIFFFISFINEHLLCFGKSVDSFHIAHKPFQEK